jgi:hypothetical protein
MNGLYILDQPICDMKTCAHIQMWWCGKTPEKKTHRGVTISPKLHIRCHFLLLADQLSIYFYELTNMV